MPKHIQNETTTFVEELNKNGFNGVRFIECRMEPVLWKNWESDGKTREEYEAFVENYAIFIAQPNLSDWYESRHKYESVEIDEFSFRRDLQEELKKRLGDGVSITHYEHTDEYEIQRIPKSESQII